MSQKDSTLELKDFIDLLRNENNILIKQLCFAQKCIEVFENYRNCLNSFSNNCKCDQNIQNQILLKDLEKDYKCLLKEDMKNCGTSDQTNETTKICFNKKRKFLENTEKSNYQSIDNQIKFGSQLTQDNLNTDSDKQLSNSVNILFNKFEDNSKRFEDNDYRLKFMKTNDTSDLSEYKCNWFKCGISFASESSLNHHKKTIHFAVNNDYNNYDFIDLKPITEQTIIDCGEDYNNMNNYKSKRPEKPLICNWVGCELRFKTEYELNRHEKSIHYSSESMSWSRSNRIPGLGLKPLTIHTLDTSFDSNDKQFKCNECYKSYTRMDRLKVHMSTDHSLGDYNYKIYKCDECDYETKNSGHLKRHTIRKHTKEKPYKCDSDECDLCFATLDQLKSHQINKHTDDRPFSCHECNASFKLRKQLNRHLETHLTAK